MPPKRINKPAGTGIILGNACCFCQRPADDAAPGGLGALIQCTSGNTALKYHEACAAYSMVIAMNCPKPGSIQEWRVNSEAQRGSNVICVLCRKTGATVKCNGKGCPRSYHLPCAREAAMKLNLNVRMDESLRPVFAAVGTSASGGVEMKNNARRNELACSDHAGVSISNPLEEPAGLWFEDCGGWDCHCPEATTVLLSGGSLEKGKTLDAAAAAAGGGAGAAGATIGAGGRQGEGSSDQTREEEMLDDRLASTAAVTVGAAAPPQPQQPLETAAAPASACNQKVATYDIPNHIWEVSACVQGPLPPLRPKEGRVLGVTLSAPVFVAYRRTVSAFISAAKKKPALRHVVVLENNASVMPKKGLIEIAKSVQKAICKAAKVESIKKVPLDLPRKVPCHPSLEAFCISKDDPRAGLASEPGSLGVRVRLHAKSIKPYEFLGIYGGLQLYFDDHIKMCDDVQLAKAIGLRCKQQLATKIESYTADEEHMQHVEHFEETVAEACFLDHATGGWFKNKSSWLCTQAFLYGNMTCLINDPTLDPFTSGTDRRTDDVTIIKNNKNNSIPKSAKTFNQNDTSDVGDPPGKLKSNLMKNSNLLAAPNCKMMSCLIRGWPFIILVSTAEIKPGQELLYLYNGKEAHQSMTIDGYWANLWDRIALETDALNALDREEELLQKLNKDRLEKEEKDREIAALKAQLRMAATFSSGQDFNSNDGGTGNCTLGGGSAVIGEVRRNAASAVANGGHGALVGAVEHRSEIIREPSSLVNDVLDDGGNKYKNTNANVGGCNNDDASGSGVTTTPNGELSVLIGSVSTEDINLENADELEELEATGGVNNAGAGGGGGGGNIQLVKQHSHVVGNACSKGIAIIRQQEKESPIPAGKFPPAGCAEDNPFLMEIIDMTKDEDGDCIKEDITTKPGNAISAHAAPTIPAAVKKTGKTYEGEKLALYKSSERPRCRSRDSTRSPERRKRRSDDSRERYTSHGRSYERKSRSNPSPVKGPGRGRGHGSLCREYLGDTRDADDRRGGAITYNNSNSTKYRQRPPPADLREMLHQSNSKSHHHQHRYQLHKKYRNSRSRSRTRSRSISRSRSREARRDRSRDGERRDLDRRERGRGTTDHTYRSNTEQESYRSRDYDDVEFTKQQQQQHQNKKKKKSTGSNTVQKNKDLPPVPLRLASTAAAGAAALPVLNSGHQPSLPPINPDSLTMTVSLSDPRFQVPERSESLSLSLPPVPPAHQLHPQHPGHQLYQMAFVIPASISDIPKTVGPESISHCHRPRSPRPVLVGTIHPPQVEPPIMQSVSQPSVTISDAPSGAWHQVVSLKKAPSFTGKKRPPSYYKGSGADGNSHGVGGSASEVYDPTQAVHQHPQTQDPPATAVPGIPWDYVSLPIPNRSHNEATKPAAKGWYEGSHGG